MDSLSLIIELASQGISLSIPPFKGDRNSRVKVLTLNMSMEIYNGSNLNLSVKLALCGDENDEIRLIETMKRMQEHFKNQMDAAMRSSTQMNFADDIPNHRVSRNIYWSAEEDFQLVNTSEFCLRKRSEGPTPCLYPNCDCKNFYNQNTINPMDHENLH